MADKDQKTHDPSAKRLDDARRKGDVPGAPEMRHAAGFAAMLVVMGGMGVHAFARLAHMLVMLWGNADDFPVESGGAQALVGAVLGRFAVALAPLLAAMVAFALLGSLIHGRPSFVWSRVAPKVGKLSPLSGAKRLFGPPALVEYGKTLAKLGTVVAVAAWVLRPRAVALDTLVGADPADVGIAAGALVVMLVKAVAIPVGMIAGFDLIYQRRSWLAKMRMSLQELKDEHKDSEGDPKIKAKIRQIAIQRSRRRMMAAVPNASVVITNPTHYAIALKYDHGRMGAPTVVAKGVDAVALKIREVATAAGVPIVENRPLARALHAAVEIDHPIPIEHYAAVAEIIGYVMRLAERAGRRE
jgi:flagellar biosynthetic protein FlhB